MEKEVFQIMYQALVEIATADNFFDESKKLSSVAKQALKAIGKVNAEKKPTPNDQ